MLSPRPPLRSLRRPFRRLAPLIAAALLGCTGSVGDDEGALRVSSVAPAMGSARGGDRVTVTGSGFASGASFRFGDEPALDVAIVSPREALVTTPPIYAGPIDVAATGPAGDAFVLARGFEALALDLRFIEAPADALPSPAEGAIAGAIPGDFDRDGRVDLFVARTGAPSLLLLGDGRGRFAESALAFIGDTIPALDAARALASADFNLDGGADVVVGQGAGQPSVLLVDRGASGFEAPTDALPADLDEVTCAAAGDLDGDGDPDLVLGNATADDVPLRVYLDDMTGTRARLEAALEGAVPARDWLVSAVAIADADADGWPDLLVATPGASDGIGLRLLRNEAGERFSDADPSMPAFPGTVSAMASGDVDGDGDIDIIAIVADGQDRLLVNDGTGRFFDDTISSMPLDASAGRAVALVDMDRDRDLDIVTANRGAATRLYLNDGTGHFLDATPAVPLHHDDSLFVGALDWDQDADTDVLLLSGSAGPSRLYLSVPPSPHETP